MADAHRAAATRARGEASASRELSHEIARREAGLSDRLALAMSRHTDDVWSSQAADRSRRRLLELTTVTTTLLCHELLRVRLALDQRAEDFEATARSELGKAELLEADLLMAVPRPSRTS